MKRRQFLKVSFSGLAISALPSFFSGHDFSIEFSIPNDLQIRAGRAVDLKRFLSRRVDESQVKFSVAEEGEPLPHGVYLKENGMLIANHLAYSHSIQGVIFEIEYGT